MAEQLGLIDSMELQHADCDTKKSLYFEDGIRKIDYVLAYVVEEDEEDREKNEAKRKKFMQSLVQEGLEYEEALSTKVRRSRVMALWTSSLCFENFKSGRYLWRGF